MLVPLVRSATRAAAPPAAADVARCILDADFVALVLEKRRSTVDELVQPLHFDISKDEDEDDNDLLPAAAFIVSASWPGRGGRIALPFFCLDGIVVARRKQASEK